MNMLYDKTDDLTMLESYDITELEEVKTLPIDELEKDNVLETIERTPAYIRWGKNQNRS